MTASTSLQVLEQGDELLHFEVLVPKLLRAHVEYQAIS
jgi:hypothetical protein